MHKLILSTIFFAALIAVGNAQTTTRAIPLQLPKASLIRRPATLPQESAAKPPVAKPINSANQSTAAGSKKASSKRLQQILALTFNRSPASILKNWSEKNGGRSETTVEKPKPPEPSDLKAEKADLLSREIRQFEQDVILGEWADVKKFLSEFRIREEAKTAYDFLLAKLLARPTLTPVTNAAPIPQGVVVAPPRGVLPDDHVIAPADILGLLDCAPSKLTSQNLTSIGQLLAKSMRQGFVPDQLLDSLQIGTGKVGGAELENKIAAARLLLAAGLPDQARTYLTDPENAAKAKDVNSLVLLAKIFQQQYDSKKKPELLEDAWKINQMILSLAEIQQGEKQAALEMAVKLAPKVREEIGQKWLEESFTSNPERGMQIIAGIGQATASGQQDFRFDTKRRLEGLQLQKTAVETLLKAAPAQASRWHMTIDLLAMTWLKEAGFSRQYARSSGVPSFRRDRYGNIFYANDDEFGAMNRAPSGARPRPVPIREILGVRPQDVWFDAISESLRNQFHEVIAKLHLKIQEEELAFPHIEAIAKSDKKTAKTLAEEFLQVWTRNHNPNDARANTNRYVYIFGFEQRANSIPLTRSKQQRNLQELQKWISRLRQLHLDELDEDSLVRAFTTCHSTAEVYRLEDIEDVFGSIDSLKPATVAGLVQKMRTNLSTAWRQPRVQESKKTNRKEPEIRLEVLRGYDVAEQIIEDGLSRTPDSWQLQLSKACIQYDRNAYQQEIKKSSDFTQKQNLVFSEFAAAASAYAAQVPGLEATQQETMVYDLWFYAALGACDLSMLTHTQVSAESQLERIRKSIEALPGEAPVRHMSQFANKLFTRMSPLKPEMKYRYLKGGFKIVGDHPDAWEARKVFQYYKDLVSEIHLQTDIDGSDVVGEEPFGLFVNLYHTEEVERESGGFSKYLQNQNNMQYAYNYGRPPNDYRDAFETAAIAALSEHFEVISVTFEDEKNLKSRAARESGWRMTPYAYILMKARGKEVDIIPPVKLDLDFLDTSGYAVLPIESKAIPVDTLTEAAEDRPMSDLKITQTLDERRSGEGRLVLEVKATATGLIPRFDDILEVPTGGFEVIETQDQGVSVSAFDPSSNAIQMISEREWLIELKAGEEAGKPESFEFFSTPVDAANMEYKRYNDADLVEVEKIVSLENQYGTASRNWIFNLALVVFVVLLIGGIGLFIARRPKTEWVPRFVMPADLTPLSVIGLLKQIRGDPAMSDAVRFDIDQSIHRIEEHYFYNQNGESPNLEEEARQWLARVN